MRPINGKSSAKWQWMPGSHLRFVGDRSQGSMGARDLLCRSGHPPAAGCSIEETCSDRLRPKNLQIEFLKSGVKGANAGNCRFCFDIRLDRQ